MTAFRGICVRSAGSRGCTRTACGPWGLLMLMAAPGHRIGDLVGTVGTLLQLAEQPSFWVTYPPWRTVTGVTEGTRAPTCPGATRRS